MSYAIEPQMYTQFKGIRQFNGVASGGAISALKCSNVELHQSEIGDGVSIKTIDGNTMYKELPEGYKIIGMFGSEQEDITYTFIYAENETTGTLFYIGADNVLNTVKTDTEDIKFTVTGECNGLTMSTTAYDVFVFTNGVEQKTICFTADAGYKDVVSAHNYKQFGLNGWIADINATDYHNDGKEIKWLAMTEWNGFLVVADKYGVHASHQNNIYLWNENPQDVADAWYIDFNKKVTALASFTGGLYIFTADDCSLLNTTPNDKTNSRMTTSSGVGCYSYTSIVKHDTYLFFYDNRQKNIYYLGVTDTTGQTKPLGPLAKEVQSYFTTNIKSFKAFSCVYNTRSEIWCIVNDDILIFDYMQKEWVTRKTQDITTLALVNNSIFTGAGNKIYVEGVGDDFDGAFYPAVYETTLINLGTNTNMKKQKTPLLLTLDTNYVNDFWVQLIRNSKEKTPKRVFVSNKQDVVYGDDEGTYGAEYDSVVFPIETIYNKKVVEISTPQTWYTLGIRIYTDTENQGFFINSMELKNLKGKTKTKGR